LNMHIRKNEKLVVWRRYLYIILIAKVLAIIGLYGCLPYLAYYIEELGVTEQRYVTVWTSIAVGLPSLLLAVFCPLWGSLSDRYGRKSMLVRTLIIGALSIYLMSWCNSVWQLISLRLVFGVFVCVTPAFSSMLASVVPQEHIGLSIGMLQTSYYFGNCIGPLIGGLTADLFGFRKSFVISSVALFLSALLIIFFVKEDLRRIEIQQKKYRIFSTFKIPKLNKSLVILGATLFVLQFTERSLVPILPQFVKGLKGVNQEYASTLIGSLMTATSVAAASASSFVGTVASKKNIYYLLVIITGCSAIIYTVHAFMHSITYLYVIRIFAGITCGVVMSIVHILIAELTPPETRGESYGISSSALYLGNFLGPMLTGGIGFIFGLRTVFILNGFLFVLISIMLYRNFPETPKLGETK